LADLTAWAGDATAAAMARIALNLDAEIPAKGLSAWARALAI
jgi:hypothetical protein